LHCLPPLLLQAASQAASEQALLFLFAFCWACAVARPTKAGPVNDINMMMMAAIRMTISQ
jgi:hypothetical protein